MHRPTQSLNRYAYTANNPLRYTDPTGHWLESALDIAFIIYDIHDIAVNGLNLTSGLSLVADVAGLALPAVTGGGLLVRGIAHADDVAKAVSHVDDIAKAATHADELVKAAAKADDVVKAASHLDEATKATSHVDNLTDIAKGGTSSQPRGGVYTLRDGSGNVQRSGRSNDVARRQVEHGRTYPDLSFQTEFRSDNYQVQRGAEQILHDTYKPRLNKIQPISPRNPRRNQYVNAARKAGMK